MEKKCKNEAVRGSNSSHWLDYEAHWWKYMSNSLEEERVLVAFFTSYTTVGVSPRLNISPLESNWCSYKHKVEIGISMVDNWVMYFHAYSIWTHLRSEAFICITLSVLNFELGSFLYLYIECWIYLFVHADSLSQY